MFRGVEDVLFDISGKVLAYCLNKQVRKDGEHVVIVLPDIPELCQLPLSMHFPELYDNQDTIKKSNRKESLQGRGQCPSIYKRIMARITRIVGTKIKEVCFAVCYRVSCVEFWNEMPILESQVNLGPRDVLLTGRPVATAVKSFK